MLHETARGQLGAGLVLSALSSCQVLTSETMKTGWNHCLDLRNAPKRSNGEPRAQHSATNGIRAIALYQGTVQHWCAGGEVQIQQIYATLEGREDRRPSAW